MIFIAIRAARDVFAIICVECGAGECGASFHAVCDNIDRSFQWLLVLHLTDISINDANARVCSEHFTPEDNTSSLLSCVHGNGMRMCRPSLYPRYVRCINKTVTSAVRVTQSPVTYSVLGIG